MQRSSGKGGRFAALISGADTVWRGISRGMLIAAGWGMLFLGAMVAVDVLARGIIGRNLGGVDEIAGYLFAIGISWSLAEAFYGRSHVRIDVLYQRLPPVGQALMDIVSVIALLLLALFLIFSSWLVVSGSWGNASRSASSLQIPLIIPQIAWALGFIVFAIALLLSGIRGLLELGRGSLAEVSRHLGVITPTEEAEDALRHSGRQN